ncbi:MAG: hypothetical protein A3D33_06265 [Candidatus Rokubacteria bacterium RIFCSPHIGHO2_02_FULL_73_26]|nr:MAG: hypothetical protein A3D33_06265 [Candidatus Rokubacteria bacterium RIFCSPHIGHO2_02_FULL_73_26]OGL29042.1 MAG: hypothetical protein A3G44_19285 [Candidatus Rokubacteria bacterium RIFCSPLOWO2_12_FULL_73_47]
MPGFADARALSVTVREVFAGGPSWAVRPGAGWAPSTTAADWSWSRSVPWRVSVTGRPPASRRTRGSLTEATWGSARAGPAAARPRATTAASRVIRAPISLIPVELPLTEDAGGRLRHRSVHRGRGGPPRTGATAPRA